MANGKPFVIRNAFEAAVGYKRDAEGKVLRNAAGKPVYETAKFEIEAVFKDTEEILKTAVKYTTWRAASRVRASKFPNKKGKVIPYALEPGKVSRVDWDGVIGLSLEDKRAKLLEELAATDAEIAARDAQEAENNIQ